MSSPNFTVSFWKVLSLSWFMILLRPKTTNLCCNTCYPPPPLSSWVEIWGHFISPEYNQSVWNFLQNNMQLAGFLIFRKRFSWVQCCLQCKHLTIIFFPDSYYHTTFANGGFQNHQDLYQHGYLSHLPYLTIKLSRAHIRKAVHVGSKNIKGHVLLKLGHLKGENPSHSLQI